MMKATVLKPGLFSSFQDLGRYGFQSAGVPVSGAMDILATSVANYLVGNEANDPVLELTYANVELLTETPMLIACCGDGVQISSENRSLDLWRTYFLPAFTHLTFNTAPTGCRCYIAVAGGWNAQEILGSSSTYSAIQIGGHSGKALQKGNHIGSREKYSELSSIILQQLSSTNIKSPSWGVMKQEIVNYSSRKIRVITHHEFDWIDKKSQKAFFKNNYTPGMQSNRMGYQLEGEPLEFNISKQLLSTAVSKGTLQVTSGGKIILLMSDCQTTGGYPRIGQVAAADLPICAQLKPGDTIGFEKISIEKAEQLYIMQQKDLLELKETISNRFISNTG